ncbi:MAG TPA: tRNA (adenosine(37)-N6)-threonylcarbamoyltransferase complex transferase subunit TsaD, partial [Gammaproteobacteria bacterium]|nr:tRNA (adenosine(37)-N6)-threonylcarbamoyltransferase complex transferase subunit TsaD [Gammaproteobacteria bacterium]
MRILGIETSCDETGVAIYDSNDNIILAEQLFSQASKHAQYGGVVPELASRDHIPKLLPLISMTLEEANLGPDKIDGIAYTSGPGLRGPLLTGAALARSLSLGWNKPCVGINHMEAHLLINLLEDPAPSFPFLTLLISGGHCLLVLASGVGKYELLGQTRDDAVGEAFDKVAKLLDLSYPGGPEVEKMAKAGDHLSYDLPRPMTKEDHLDFSFSGLKTAVYYLVKSQRQKNQEFIQNICASFQNAVAETLISKCKRALSVHNLSQLVVGGGVAANLYLRDRLEVELRG